MMDIQTEYGLKYYRDIYRNGLLGDTLPFWLPRSFDKEYGGFLTCFDRSGTLLQSDKSIWFQGRYTWMLSTLYNTISGEITGKPEWLAYSRSALDFLDKYGFDKDGRMFFWVTREGEPLRKRRYLFSEMFAIIAKAAYSIAANDSKRRNEAMELFKKVLAYRHDPVSCPPKTDPKTRAMKGLGIPMILINVAQELRKSVDDPILTETIDASIDEIEHDFMKPEFSMVLETVGPNGQFIDSLDGRSCVPGHAIETAWFILEEARLRQNDPRLIKIGTTILDWSLDAGWDDEFGGIYYYRDCKGLPCSEYCHSMKFWWPHNEAIIATLLAWQLTRNPKYAAWHQLVHQWAYAHFPDPLHGEWYGYLHRNGSVSSELKGNMWKGLFHLPRMQWYCWQRLDEMLAE